MANAGENSNNNDCDEQTCLTWRVLKILGTAVGVGFIVSIFSPVLFYFIILNIGYLCYGKQHSFKVYELIIGNLYFFFFKDSYFCFGHFHVKLI